jgi:hypothetical protein
MTTWQSLLLAFGGQVALLAALAFLLKAIISHRLSQEAEAFKTTLQAQANVEIERLKSSLQITVAEHQVRFSKLHERRAVVIAKLYRLLLLAADAAKVLAVHPNDREVAKEAQKQQLDLYRFFQLNKIYLPSALCAPLSEYESRLRHEILTVDLYWREENPNAQMAQEQAQVMREAWRALETELPLALAGLEKEFRELLGVEAKAG